MANYDSSEQKIQERIARGKKLIYPQKQEEWERKVRNEATIATPTSGSIDISLEVMEMLENGASVNEAYKRFLQLINSNTSLKWDSLSLILLFSKRGAEFYEAVIISYGGMNEEDKKTVEQIKKQNEEFEKAQYATEMFEARGNLLNNVTSYIERGTKLIYPQRLSEWENFVKDRAKTSILYFGAYIKYGLEIMEMLENGSSIEEAVDYFSGLDIDSGIEWEIRNMVLRFSKKGPDFYQQTIRGLVSDSEKQFFDRIVNENKGYASSGEYSGGGRTN